MTNRYILTESQLNKYLFDGNMTVNEKNALEDLIVNRMLEVYVFMYEKVGGGKIKSIYIDKLYISNCFNLEWWHHTDISFSKRPDLEFLKESSELYIPFLFMENQKIEETLLKWNDAYVKKLEKERKKELEKRQAKEELKEKMKKCLLDNGFTEKDIKLLRGK